MRERDIKLLWSRAAGRCSLCRTEVTQDTKATSGKFPIGEQAHIVGEKKDSARWTPTFNEKEAAQYHNLILVCPNCHSKIDDKDSRTNYPVELLHKFKTVHELWVQDSLSGPRSAIEEAHAQVYARLIDSAVELYQLDEWRSLTNSALSTDPHWPIVIADNSEIFATRILGAVFSGQHPRLESVLSIFSRAMHEASQHYSRFETWDHYEGSITPKPFHKVLQTWDELEYHRRLKMWKEWLRLREQWIYFLTKAANWFADEVRAAINPLFFLEKDRFLVFDPGDMLSGTTTTFVEFTTKEKEAFAKSSKKLPLELERLITASKAIRPY